MKRYKVWTQIESYDDDQPDVEPMNESEEVVLAEFTTCEDAWAFIVHTVNRGNAERHSAESRHIGPAPVLTERDGPC